MATAVYVLCALTAGACAFLLTRAWLRSRQRLLLWSALCFAWLTANNVLLFVDLSLVESADLAWARSATHLVGVSVLLAGLIWDAAAGRRA